MSEVTSSAYLTHYVKERGHCMPSYAGFFFCEKPELVDLLFKYAEHLGVEKYEELDGITVRWLLKGSWYSTEQIERMMGLPIFI